MTILTIVKIDDSRKINYEELHCNKNYNEKL